MAVEFHRLTIADVRRETPDAVSIAFAVPPQLAEAYRFHPGQHLTLRTQCNGEELRRSYSICTGLDDRELRVAVKKVEGGLFSTLCNERIKPGDEIDVMTPQGRFGIEPDPAIARTYLAVAAGSGITPILSLLRTILTREQKSRFTLIYGNRSTQNIIFKEALEDLKDRFLGRLAVHHVLSQEKQDIGLLNGRIDGAKIETLLRSLGPAMTIDHAFLCGPGGLIEDGRATLMRLGLEPERIHVEYFTADGRPSAERKVARTNGAGTTPVAHAHVTLNGLVHDVSVHAGETVVDAGLRAGLEMPYSCRGGMCCTCRAKLVSGEAKMDVNYSLESWEIAAGYILTCQARPTTPDIVIDYDEV